MRIEHKTLIIKKTDKVSSDYVEEEIKNFGYLPLRWAITKVNSDSYTVDCAVILS